MTECNQPDGQGTDATQVGQNNWLSLAIKETERVQKRIDDMLEDRVDHAYILLGMIPNATARIIDELNTAQTVRDHCAVFHASRVFNNALGAFMLLRRGLLVEATTLTRSTLETATQAVVLMRHEDDAARWDKGKKFAPGEIRKKLGGNPDVRPLYDALSSITHANPEARLSHSVAIPSIGYAISYGGTYQPKRAAKLLWVLMQIIGMYLSEFYEQYKERLSVYFWPFMLDIGHRMNNDLWIWAEGLSDDQEALAAYLTETAPRWIPSPPVGREALAKLMASMRKPPSAGADEGQDPD